MESYRSGHNGAVLKTVRAQVHRGSNPLLSAMKKALANASAFFNDVCLRQMMSLTLMMTATPNDVASLMFLANIASLRPKGATSLCDSITSCRRRRCIIEITLYMVYNFQKEASL